ncbi:MAG: radical SAM protein [Nanoarchaeota archaeon]|nr:radical SAM protein [Nanoarchaeota archaeon]
MKICLCCEGVCPRRHLDLEKLKQWFKENNCEIIPKTKISKADYIIYIPCGFIYQYFNNAIKRIKQFQGLNPKLIVGGCLWDIDKESINKEFKGKYFTTKNIEKIEKFFPEFKISLGKIPDQNKMSIEDAIYWDKPFIENISTPITLTEKIKNKLNKKPKIFTIRISDGCINNCTYCSHRKAIGNLKSKPLEEIKSEFIKGSQQEYNIFCLTGMDSANYGLDIKTTYPILIKDLIKINPKAKFILDEINPKWFIKYHNELYILCKNKKIKLISIPIQSGNNRILKLMNRQYNSEEVLSKIRILRKKFPKVTIKTQLIIGFPSETEKEFQDSINFVKAGKFYSCHLHPYSEYPNLKSAKINPKIPKEIINTRIQKAIRFFKDNKIHFKAYL